MVIGIILITSLVYGDATEKQSAGMRERAEMDLPKQITALDGAPMVLIPAGEFQMGSNDGSSDEKPVHKVYTDAFYMDRCEVTNAQYAKFLSKYGKATDQSRHKLLDVGKNSLIERVGDTYVPEAGYENHPAIVVSWYGASVYAQYYGKRLPTEAEWEKAARGGLVGKKYPWGDAEPDGTQCNFADSSAYGKWLDSKWSDKGVDDGFKFTAPVGSYPPNGYGLYDMAGNVWEWCADWSGWYSGSPEKNPTGPTSGTCRVLRGGSWNNTPTHIRVAYRYSRDPERTTVYIGFRCARNAIP
jgi:formylglycine-generating enzyme required for sulfatase activity